MATREKVTKPKRTKSADSVYKFFKNRESEITEAIWKDSTLEIFFSGGSFKIQSFSPEDAAMILNHLYLAYGSLYYEAIGKMRVSSVVHFSKKDLNYGES